MSWLKKLTSGLKKSSEKVTQNLSGLTRLFGKEKIDAASLEELEDALIMADIGVSAAADIAQALRSHNWQGAEVSPEALREELSTHLAEILGPVEQPLDVSGEHHPHVILMVGVNGSGKNHHIGKAGGPPPRIRANR